MLLWTSKSKMMKYQTVKNPRLLGVVLDPLFTFLEAGRRFGDAATIGDVAWTRTDGHTLLCVDAKR